MFGDARDHPRTFIVREGDSVTGEILSHRLRRVLQRRETSTWGRRHSNGGWGRLHNSSSMSPPERSAWGETLYCDTGRVSLCIGLFGGIDSDGIIMIIIIIIIFITIVDKLQQSTCTM